MDEEKLACMPNSVIKLQIGKAIRVEIHFDGYMQTYSIIQRGSGQLSTKYGQSTPQGLLCSQEYRV